jgi:hypothetical protein
MTTPLTDAEQAERQARIQDDIRRLFARYRRTGQTVTRFAGTGQPTSAARFRRDTSEPPKPAKSGS